MSDSEDKMILINGSDIICLQLVNARYVCFSILNENIIYLW